MSNRKVFQAAPRPKASQANTLDANLKRIDANASKKTRRKGVRKIDAGLGEGSEDQGRDEQKGSLQEEGGSKGLTIELPEVSPTKEAMTPNTRARLKKANVKGSQLKSPMGLRHRKIPNIFNPKKERKESTEPMTMAEIENQDLAEESPDEEGLDEEGNLTLNARLMGLPGNLEMSAEVTSKYFGLEGRAKFHNRVQWMQGQRMKACLEPDEENQPLYFADSFDSHPSTHLSSAIPFGASRQAERAEFTGSLDEPSAEDLAQELHGAGSSFFKRFKNPVQQAKAGLGFITPNGRLDGYLDNENTMLRMSRLRSGDDPRDEEEADESFPLRAEARERDMTEAYAHMLQAEAQHAATDEEAEQRRREIDLLIQRQGPAPGPGPGPAPAAYDHGKDGSLVLGGDFSLASVGTLGYNESIDNKGDTDRYGGGGADADALQNNDDHEARGDLENDDGEESETESDRERRMIREMVRRGAPSKGRTWKRGYMRSYAANLNFDHGDGDATTNGESPAAAAAAGGQKKSRRKVMQGRDDDSNSLPGARRGMASVTVSKGELARLQRLAANNALVSSLTFEALSLANEALGELPVDGEVAKGVEEGDADADESESENEGEGGEADAGTEEGHGGAAVSDEVRRRAAGQVSDYRYMQLSMSTEEKQKYYLNRRPSTSYDSPPPKPKSDLALPKRTYYKESELEKAVVGTGGINEAKKLLEKKTRRQERRRVKALEAEVANSGGLSPVHRVRQLRQISALPRDMSLIRDLQESVKTQKHLHTGDGTSESDNDDDSDDGSGPPGGAGDNYYQRASSRRNSASSTSSISTLNLRLDMLDKGSDLAVPLSPRSKFISNCIRERLNPRAGLLVRKMTTKKLELQNYGMGDQMARILADSIADLPYLQSINIADNRLTDEGMGPIILAAVKINDLLELNLSKNEIGDVSSDALATYLRDPQCTLQRLVMQTADVDDFEAEPFIDAVKENRSLLELDLTDNLIGGAENLNTVMPDLITGSEAIADLLREGDIKLHTLKLPWNMIRLDGGVDLCSALSVNDTITYLDLSYNSLAQDGGTALGVALEDNTTLTHLIISNNNIDAVACFTICCGIIHNTALQKIVFDGNPIAEQGARALMLVPMYAGGRVDVSARKCNITMRDPRCWFDFDKPCREYQLDMEDGFQRAISMILLLVIACHHSFVFDAVTWYPDKDSTRGAEEIKLKQALSRERTKHFQSREKIIVGALTKIKDSAADINAAIRLFQEVDEDGSGEIDREEFTEMVRQMGIGMSDSRIDEVFNMYDVDGGGSIGLSEFLSFLKTQKSEASARIDDLCNMPIMTVDDGVPIRESKGKYYTPWRPPKTGKLDYTVIDGFVEKEIKKTMSSVDQKNIENVINNAGDGGGGQASSMISHAISSAKLRLDEALACCTTMLTDGKDATKIMRMVLPQVGNFEDAQAVVKAITNGDRTALMKLKREVGDSLRPILGAPNGYYTLDLSDDMDRFCLTRLVEISSTNAKRRKEANAFFPSTQIGDLSQKRNWSSFRNEMFNGEPIEIDVAFASPLPRSGHLQFDFVCGSYIRPRPDDMVLTDSRVVKVLCNSFLLEPTDCVGALKKLKHYFARGESALDCDGHTIFENPTKRAHHVGLHIDDFYDNIHLRKKEYEENMRRENQVVYDANGAAIDDLDDDEYDQHEAHDTSGYKFESSKSLVACMAVRGVDITKLTRKQRRTMQLSGPDGANSDDDETEGGEHDGSDTASLSMSMASTVEGGGGGNTQGDEDGAASVTSAEESTAGSVDPQMWKCLTCFTKNIVGENNDHCTMCDASRPDHQHGHGIGADVDPATAGEEDAIVMKALRKKGNIEGAHKYDASAVVGENDPRGLLVKLRANEAVEHKKNELDGSASESDLEAASSVGHSDTDSTNSDEELDGDEEEDMVNYVKNKIAERRAEEKAKRAEERRRKREERRLAREQKKGSMASDGNEEGEGEGDEDEAEEGNQTDQDKRKVLLGLNLLSTKQIEDQQRANEEAKTLEDFKDKEREMQNREMGAHGDDDPAGDGAPRDADALKETSEQKSKRTTDAEDYAAKMRELLEKKHMHIGLKARRIVEWLEELFGRVWFFSRHLALILEVFRGAGHKKQTRHFGTYRVEVFVLLFHRVVDLHNIELALKVLSPYEVACVHCRMGWLHLWNPCKPEGAWELNLTRPEERLVAKMLCELATVEPGDNWIEQYFQWQRDSEGMPGWELTTPWLTEDGMPCRGVLTLYYYSGGGKLLRGCSPNVPFRKSLLHLVLIEEQEIVEEGFRDRPPTNLVGGQYVYSNPGRWKQYLGAIVDLTRTR